MIEEAETLDAAGAVDLAPIASGLPGLETVVVFLRELDHELAHWARAADGPKPARVSALARPLLHAALDAHSELSEGGASPSLGVELGGRVLFVEGVAGFGVAAAFDRSTPLGMSRLAMRRLVDAVEVELTRSMRAPPTRAQNAVPAAPAVPPPSPSKPVSQTETGDRIRALLSALETSSPDPHLVLTRIALRTGLGVDVLRAPDAMPPDTARLVEAAARELRDEAPARGLEPAERRP